MTDFFAIRVTIRLTVVSCLWLCLIVGCNSQRSSSEGTSPSESTTSPTGSADAIDPTSSEQRHEQRAVAAVETSEGKLHFASVAADAGVEFVYQNGASGKLLMVESLGGGAGWLDFDRDGLLDVWFCQGGDPATMQPATRPLDQLFRQRSTGSFVSATEFAGISETGYSQGVAVGDFDNDGFPDVYVTNCGPNTFFRNLGDGTFEEVAAQISIDDSRWSSSAAWADLDLDGDLDLYVCNYVQYDPLNPMKCEKDGRPALCHPRQIPHWPDECYENQGDGTFVPRARDWGLFGDGNKGLGVVVADLTNDGFPDIYVANDTTPNFLFVSARGKGFTESALRLGTALSGDGAMQASMGVAIGDYDRSGTLDLCLTHFTGESNTLYQNLGAFGFNDVSGLTGIHQATLNRLGFGTVMHDFDANGTMEMMVTNGHIDDLHADGDGYEQLPMLLTWNGSRWKDVSAAACPEFTQKRVGRGIALGDYDADGDDDMLIVHQNSPSMLLRNDSDGGHWLRLQFIGRRSSRSGQGT
ncbi:MAG: VCBS repeat-containing protein, partial [Planctomycetaceae bacterium]|nr:VCBS repeat-containing protein [Planctomycetaceae bacterium]